MVIIDKVNSRYFKYFKFFKYTIIISITMRKVEKKGYIDGINKKSNHSRWFKP